jgi:iron complex outermembrane receptor protein
MRLCAYTAAIAAGGFLLLASSANAQAPEPPTPAPPAAGSTQLPPVVVDAPAQKKAAPKKKSAKAKQKSAAPVVSAAPTPTTPPPAPSQGLSGELLRASQQNTSGVTTFTAADVQRSGDTGVYDVIKSTPNLTPAAGGATLPAIRGEGAGPSDLGGTLLYGTSPQSVLVVDNVARVSSYANSSFQNLYDVSWVDVLKGPQPAVVGTNAFAGAFVVKTNDPEFKWYGESFSEITWNEFSGLNYRVAGVANAPLSSEAAMRLVVQFEEGDDPYDVLVKGAPNATPTPPPRKDLEEINDFRTLNLRGKFLVEPDSIPGLTVLATAEYQSGIDNAFNSFVDLPSKSGRRYRDRASLYSNDIRIFDTEAWVGGLTATYALSSREELKSVTSYLSDHFSSAPQSLGTKIDDVTETRFAQDLQYGFRGVSNMTGVVGVSVTQDDRYYGISVPIKLQQDFEIENQAVYADVAWNFAPRFDLLFGGRVDHRRDDRWTYVDAAFAPPATRLYSDEETYLLPKIGLQYRLDIDETIAATVRQGYNPGGAFANIYTGVYFEFQDETMWTYEVAYRNRLLQDQLSVGVTAFYNDYKDKQLFISKSVLDYTIINEPKARSYGLELEAKAAVTKDLDVTAGVGLLQTELIDVTAATLQIVKGDNFGLDPAVTPSLMLAWRPVEGVELTGKAMYVSSYYSYVNAPAYKAGDYTLLDIGASYTLGPIVARAFINNVTDEVAQATVYEAGATLLPPRTFGTSLKVSF